MLGTETPIVLLDAACASSLFALDLGVQSLRAREADLVYVGGVFTVGPCNSVLFAQFGGLSATGSHALDRRADGVVFGEGAAILGIRRLDDALARGEKVLAVVRATGLSSDGPSVSVNVPKSAGQVAAMRAAYETSGVDQQSIQYVEAHATATPVGDATEFEALASVFGGRDPRLPRIKLGSVKSLLGHTGWLAGAASLIKVIQSFEHNVIPPHFGWSAPDARMDLKGSPFQIDTSPQPWANRSNEPRRAAVNGFGFGGTNAHVVLEAFDPDCHKPAGGTAVPEADIVCVGFGAGFSGTGPELTAIPEKRSPRINAEAFRLPRNKRMMPDALEHMDASQFSVLAAADRALVSSRVDLAASKERMAVVIGTSGKARRGIAANQRILADRLRRELELQLLRIGQDPESAAAVASALMTALKESVPPSNPYTLVGMMPNLVAGRVANVFGLVGPNLVVDAGSRSLLSAIRVASSYLRHGVCDYVLTGGVNATAPWPRAGLPPGEDGTEPDGAVVLVVTHREIARKNGLKILAGVTAKDEIILTPEKAQGSNCAEIVLGRPNETTGLAILAAAFSALGEGGPAWRMRWLGAKAAHPPASGATKRQMRDTRQVDFYSMVPVPVPRPALAADMPRRILLITDQTDLAHRLRGHPLLKHSTIQPIIADSAANEALAARIDPGDVDLVLVARNLGAVPPLALLGPDAKAAPVVDLAFLVVRQLHQQVATGSLPVMSLHMNGWSSSSLHPDAALIHGFLKSVAREWPTSIVRAIATDSSEVGTGVDALARELGLGLANPDVEIIERNSARHALRFSLATPSAGSNVPPFNAESVVVLTGGARGVTAVMAEALLERYGCKLILLGRSDPEGVPVTMRAMSLEEMDAYETEYYRSARVREPKPTMVELRREFARLKASHETWNTIVKLRGLGEVTYHKVDITKSQEIDAVVRETVEKYGGITLVVHGAGLQVSKRLSNRQLADFQQVVATKLDGLRNLFSACNRYAGSDVQFHLLTSAFSAIGNDGQPDYGAANEAMAALACIQPQQTRWTALGWLGWAGIGMTRGSEYAALGKSRGLRAIMPEEGKEFFRQMLEDLTCSPALSLLSGGEVAFYNLPLLEQRRPATTSRLPANETTLEWPLSLQSAPYLADHIVNGFPTLPGTFEVEFSLRAARALRPDLHYVAVENPRFRQFVRVPEQGVLLRAKARVVDESASGTVIAVKLLSDFVHKSGKVLQRDVLHFECEVLVGTTPFSVKETVFKSSDLTPSVACADPFLAQGSPVKLGGMFASLDDIQIGKNIRSARFHLDRRHSLDALAGFIAPVVLLDALFRLLGLAPDGETKTGTVSVPVAGGSFRFLAGATDIGLQGTTLILTASNPRTEGNQLVMEWGQVIDGDGRVIAAIQHAVARRMGAPAPMLSKT
jgi:3-oxoacyl-(acyl-carrier-protein) synthase/NAD(P)-dependent dehydrogenase (short-subunit alcohol dehydrogenase family)